MVALLAGLGCLALATVLTVPLVQQLLHAGDSFGWTVLFAVSFGLLALAPVMLGGALGALATVFARPRWMGIVAIALSVTPIVPLVIYAVIASLNS